MRIKFVKSPVKSFGLAYFINDEVDLEEKQANELIRLKYAIQVGADKPRSEIGLPRSFPHRELFDKLGFDSIENIKEIDNLEKLSGVTEKIAFDVLEYLYPKKSEQATEPEVEKAIIETPKRKIKK